MSRDIILFHNINDLIINFNFIYPYNNMHEHIKNLIKSKYLTFQELLYIFTT